MKNVKYKVQAVCGNVKHDVDTNLTRSEALHICRSNNWEITDENGIVWELEYTYDNSSAYIEYATSNT